jgi:Carboxypeptidase regulatory-like domain
MHELRVSFPRPCDEEWEAMAPAGRGRACARCDRVVHDLSLYEADEAEALLRGDPDTCVRARIGADGAVALKAGRRSAARRMVVAAAAAAGLVTAAAPAFAKAQGPGGVIAGKVESFGFRVRVTATASDGRTFRTRSSNNGRFRIKRVPAGTYRLTFAPGCGEEWTLDDVVVGDGETMVKDVQDPDRAGCIVVGKLAIEPDLG